jgi:hypothetical protein
MMSRERRLPVTQQRREVRLAASLLVGGEILFAIARAFHAGSGSPNNHAAVFKQYAASGTWLAAHIGLFASGLLIVAGLIVLCGALARTEGASTLAILIGSGAVLIAAGQGLVLAVDGVALKQAVDVWVQAVGPAKAVAFHDAEVVRWLEWGANCFLALVQGVTFILLGLAIGRSAILSRWLGWVSILAGLGYLAGGVIVGHAGFSVSLTVAQAATLLLFLILVVGIAITGWRSTEPEAAARS